MRIEVATSLGAAGANKKKGDLLQAFARDFATTQGLQVVEELRTASSEIDLHCEDTATGQTIYLECKAHRDPLSKTALTNLMGVVYGEDYSQGWLISTGPLSKDAKGYVHNWSRKKQPDRAKLKAHSDADLAELFIKARLVKDPRGISLDEFTKPGHSAPIWVLLITESGRYWTTARFRGGIASEVLVLNAVNLSAVEDRALLSRLAQLDSSWKELPFVSTFSLAQVVPDKDALTIAPPVIETVEGRKWSDTRPARLEDFAGRIREQSEIFEILEQARHGQIGTRVFAITGESGIGKSSLITSVRGRTRQRRMKKRHFAIAIDCRAAKSKHYINASLIRGLVKARDAGFGDQSASEIVATNPDHPLSSYTISSFLRSVQEREQSICIMFDQFEEIYAKPELSEIFESAHNLFLSAVSDAGPLVLGFAWRSNFAVQQDHPAYFMWQKLAEHRQEFVLRPLETSEVNSALTSFEKELGEQLTIEARRQLIEAARGYPWVLKKLCIHLLQQVKEQSREQSSVENLSVQNLFSRDLNALSDLEKNTLKFIAENAPVAAFEVAEAYGAAPLNKLESELLVTRSGEMLNIYWDIFRDFLVRGSIPDLPFSFLPSSPSIASMLSVANELQVTSGKSIEQIAEPAQLAPRTVSNVIRDLLIMGVAGGTYSRPKLASGLNPSDPKSVMRRARSALSKHTLLWQLNSIRTEGNFTEDEICQALSVIPSIPDYDEKNLLRHVRQLTTWFAAAGFFQVTSTGWRVTDIGDVDLSYSEQSRRRSSGPFNGGSTPARALEVLKIVEKESSIDPSTIQSAGYPKAFSTLSRFGLIAKLENAWIYVAAEGKEIGMTLQQRLHEAAVKQASLTETVRLLNCNENLSGPKLAMHIAEHFGEDWSDGSLKRTGNALKRWGNWLIECETNGSVVEPEEGVRGSKSRDTPEMMIKVNKMLSSGMTKKAIVAEIGVTHTTLNRWLAREKIDKLGIQSKAST